MICLEISISLLVENVDKPRVGFSNVTWLQLRRSAATPSRSRLLNSSASDDRDNVPMDEYIPEIRIDTARGRRRRKRAGSAPPARGCTCIRFRLVAKSTNSTRKPDDVCEAEWRKSRSNGSRSRRWHPYRYCLPIRGVPEARMEIARACWTRVATPGQAAPQALALSLMRIVLSCMPDSISTPGVSNFSCAPLIPRSLSRLYSPLCPPLGERSMPKPSSGASSVSLALCLSLSLPSSVRSVLSIRNGDPVRRIYGRMPKDI